MPRSSTGGAAHQFTRSGANFRASSLAWAAGANREKHALETRLLLQGVIRASRLVLIASFTPDGFSAMVGLYPRRLFWTFFSAYRP